MWKYIYFLGFGWASSDFLVWRKNKGVVCANLPWNVFGAHKAYRKWSFFLSFPEITCFQEMEKIVFGFFSRVYTHIPAIHKCVKFSLQISDKYIFTSGYRPGMLLEPLWNFFPECFIPIRNFSSLRFSHMQNAHMWLCDLCGGCRYFLILRRALFRPNTFLVFVIHIHLRVEFSSHHTKNFLINLLQ